MVAFSRSSNPTHSLLHPSIQPRTNSVRLTIFLLITTYNFETYAQGELPHLPVKLLYLQYVPSITFYNSPNLHQYHDRTNHNPQPIPVRNPIPKSDFYTPTTYSLLDWSPTSSMPSKPQISPSSFAPIMMPFIWEKNRNNLLTKMNGHLLQEKLRQSASSDCNLHQISLTSF